jgi:hypothetical protein
VQRSIANSLAFGLYKGGRQIGMARVTDLQGFRRWLLATSTAAGLYRKVGWSPVARPEIFMETSVPDIYTRRKPTGTE